MTIDAEELYYQLRALVESTGATISDQADSLLGEAATAVAEGQDQ